MRPQHVPAPKTALFCWQAMTLARAAAVVRACAFPLLPDQRDSWHLPYCAGSSEAKIFEILRTGTCPDLEDHRCAGSPSPLLGFLSGDSGACASVSRLP